MELIVKNLKGGYGSKTVLNGISFEAKSGELIYVLGANGCGKTTLLNILIGYKPSYSGEIEIGGKNLMEYDIKERSQKLSYIPQQHVPAFEYSALDVVVMGRAGSIAFFESPKKADYEKARAALEMLGIPEFADKDYTRLSGGERQLVLIARAICQGADIIMMDEPMQSLDFINQSMVQHAARLLAEQGHLVIMSTHTAINNYKENDKTLLMSKDGTAVFGAIEKTMTQNNAEKAYGTHLQIIYNEDKKGGRHITCLPLGI